MGFIELLNKIFIIFPPCSKFFTILSSYIWSYSTNVSRMYRIGTAWFFIFLYLLMAFLLIDLIGLILPKFKPFFIHQWSSTVILLALLAVIFIGGNGVYHHQVRVPLNIKIRKTLKRPLKIVAVSDLHLGYTIGPGEAASWEIGRAHV